MIKNRVFTPKEASDVEKFGSFSAFRSSSPFEGPDVKTLLEFAKSQSFFEGFKTGVDKGYNLALKNLEANITKRLDSYILLNTKIVDFITAEIKGKFKPEEFKLVETRANFYKFSEGLINIVFVIEAEIENQLWLASLLSGLEKKIFEEDDTICELMFINKKGKEIDTELLYCNYPFFRKPE